MYNGRNAWKAFREELLTLPDAHETNPYHPDDETTVCVVRAGDVYTVHVESCATRSDGIPETYFRGQQDYDLHGAIGATGAT